LSVLKEESTHTAAPEMKWNQRNRAGTKKQKNMAANQVDYSQDKGGRSFIRAGRKTPKPTRD